MSTSITKLVTVLRALQYLLLVEIIMRRKGFQGVHGYVGSFRISSPAGSRRDLRLLLACFFLAHRLYLARLKCLHLGAACGVFLRSYGWPADVVFGVTRRPFFAHVWVELEGRAVFGTYDSSRYLVLDRI